MSRTSARSATWSVLPAALVLSALLAGCGGGTSSASGGGSSSWKDCKLAPASVVNAKLGTSFGDPSVNGQGDVLVCNYTDAAKGSTAIVRFESGVSSLKTSRDGFTSTNQTTSDLAGLGDEAFTSVLAVSNGLVPPTNTVVTRRGGVSLLITSQASLDAEQALARELLPKL